MRSADEANLQAGKSKAEESGRGGRDGARTEGALGACGFDGPALRGEGERGRRKGWRGSARESDSEAGAVLIIACLYASMKARPTMGAPTMATRMIAAMTGGSCARY